MSDIHREYMIGQINPVTGVINDWLAAEIFNANRGRNGYMREFEATQPYLQVPFDDSGNWLSLKSEGHHSRFPHFLNAFVEYPKDDYATGRLSLAALMFASGGYRWECLLRARDASSYANFRNGASSSADIAQVVQDTYQAETTKTESSRLRFAKFAVIASGINEKIFGLDIQTVEWANNNALPAASDSEPVAAQRHVQRLAIELAAAQISLAAELRGGLQEVPLLKPKSITDAEVYFPFQIVA